MGKSRAPAPPDPQVVASTQGQLNRENIMDMARVNRPNMNSPFGTSTWTTEDGLNYTNNQTYDPRILDNYWKQVGLESGMLDSADKMRANVMGNLFNGPGGSYRAFDPQHIPGMVDSINTNQVIGDVDLSGLSALPGQDDFGGERQRVEDAMYGRSSARLDPEWQSRKAALESDLMNQGFARGSEGYNSAMGDYERQREAAYAGARNDAVMGGGQEQSRMFGDALAARQQGAGEQFQRAGFYNQAAGQDYDQRFTSGQFQNANRAQRFGEELSKRNQMLNEYSQMLGMSGPQALPQFQTAAQIQGPGPADYTSAAMGAYNGQVANANARQGSKNAGIGGAATIAAAFV